MAAVSTQWRGGCQGGGWVGGVGGVEAGAESDGVVAVALQGTDAYVLASVLGAVQRVADGLSEQGVGADLDEGVVIGSRSGDGLLEAHRIAHVRGPVLGVECRVGLQVFISGGDDRNGRWPRSQIGQLR